MTNLFSTFPETNEESFRPLTLYESVQSQVGSFYNDLYGNVSGNSKNSSPLNSDRGLYLAAKLRSTLAFYVVGLFNSVSSGDNYVSSVFRRVGNKFAVEYEEFAAILVQRWWRSIKKKGKEGDKAKVAFKNLMRAHPAFAKDIDENKFRRTNILKMLYGEEVPAE